MFPLPDSHKAYDTVVLANGAYPTNNIPLSILKQAKRIVACDGAAISLINNGIVPTAIVGDCDSLPPSFIEKYKELVHIISEQDTNDLSKAIRFCVLQHWRDITILGGTGKREDHTIGNISLLSEYMKIANVEMISDYGVFNAIDKTATFESFKGQQVSIFSLDNEPFSSENLLYPINNQIFNRWWQATLNESLGKSFKLITHTPLIVFREFDAIDSKLNR